MSSYSGAERGAGYRQTKSFAVQRRQAGVCLVHLRFALLQQMHAGRLDTLDAETIAYGAQK